MKNERTLSPKIAASLATAVSAASSKAAIVSWSIAPGSMQAVNGSRTLVLSTSSSIRMDHHVTVFGTGYLIVSVRRFANVGAGGDVEMRAAMGKGADFNFKASSGFSFGSMFFDWRGAASPSGMRVSGAPSTFGGIGNGVRLIPLKFTDASGNRLLGMAEVDFDLVSWPGYPIYPSPDPGYANLVNFWYTNDPSVNELRWDAGSQQVLEVGPTPVPEPRGGAVVLLAGLAALAQSRRRLPQAKGLGVLAAGMGGMVARAGQEES